MTSAEINYLSSQSVCRLFSIEQDKGQAFINGYELRKDRLRNEIQKVITRSGLDEVSRGKFISTDEKVAKIYGDLSCLKSGIVYKLKVNKLSRGQVLETKYLLGDVAKSEVKRGKKISISISFKNKEYLISIDIKKGEVYKDILDLISNEISLSPFGLKSNVISEKRKGNLKLRVEGMQGEDNRFTIKIKGDECIKSLFNVTPIKEACDYEYELGSRKLKSITNKISINKKVNAVILKEGLVDIMSVLDSEKIAKLVDNVVIKYNDLINFMMENKNYVVVSKELVRYQEILKHMLYELSLLGIDITLSGKLVFDKKKLKKILLSDSLYTFKYLFKEGGLISKILLLLDTSTISIGQIVQGISKRAYVLSVFEKVNGKTMSHEPFFMIE